MDYNILTSILVERLSKIIDSYVSADQFGFIKGTFMKDNIRRLVSIVGKAPMDKVPTLFLFLDVEKAFDKIEWSYLKTVARRFGLGVFFRKWIGVIYNEQAAVVMIHGHQ